MRSTNRNFVMVLIDGRLMRFANVRIIFESLMLSEGELSTNRRVWRYGTAGGRGAFWR